jgi:hypothetical protein
LVTVPVVLAPGSAQLFGAVVVKARRLALALALYAVVPANDVSKKAKIIMNTAAAFNWRPTPPLIIG